MLSVYRVLVPASFLFLFANAVALAAYAIKARVRAYLLLASPENLLVAVACCSLLVLSLGEVKEEARLVLSVLPFLAAFPLARSASSAPVGPH